MNIFRIPMRIIFIVSILGFGMSCANAQGTFATPDKAVPTTESLLEEYTTGQYGTRAGARTLGTIHARGLARTPRNAALVRSALTRKITDDETVALLRILGFLYTFDNKTGMNAGILRDLRARVYSTSDDVARAAVLAITRTGYLDDLDAVLTYAANRKLINNDVRYGEMAHALPYAPRNQQNALISMIAKGKSGYAMEILANGINPASARSLDPAAARSLVALFKANEPAYPMALSAFGFRDILRYNYWLNATALLHESTGRGSYTAFVLDTLVDAETDPRKALGFLSAAQGLHVIKSTQDIALLDKSAQKAVSYAESFPQDPLMNEMAQAIKLAIAAR